jgi:hypothetical protein
LLCAISSARAALADVIFDVTLRLATARADNGFMGTLVYWCSHVILVLSVNRGESMKWEYDVVNLPLGINDVKRLLTKLGNEGWEIIAITEQSSMMSQANRDESPYFVYLKKQKR